MMHYFRIPVENVVGENPTANGILAMWAVNGLSIVYSDMTYKYNI